VILFWNKVRR